MKRLQYVKSYRDRHGVTRHYFRRPGFQTIPLPGEYGSKPFMDAYWAAMDGAPRREIGAEKVIPGSLNALIVHYYRSSNFTECQPKTQTTYRGALERLRATKMPSGGTYGDLLVTGLRQRHILAILGAFPGRQENLRKALRLVLNAGIERGWIDTHPMAGLRLPRKPLKGFPAWSLGDIAAFEAKWPTGSRERLALALLLYTGQRRSDVVTMGRQHVRDGKIHVVQQKTGSRLAIRIHAKLQVELDAAPKDQLTFLQTQYGQPFSGAGFTAWFGKKAVAAGLTDDRTPHGLRKSAAVMLAQAGCTPSEIMAVTGHKNLSEVTLYTDAVNQERLADEAMTKAEKGTKVSTPDRPGRQNAS